MAHSRSSLGAVLLAVFVLAGAWPAHAEPEEALEFALEDQFGRPHEASEFSGRFVVLVVADRSRGSSSDAWARSLREALASSEVRASIVRVVDLRGVPFFMKAMIRKRLSRRPDEWSLLDWEGQIARRYPLEAGRANLLVFDGEGRLLGRASGASPEAEPVSSLVALMEAARER